MPEKIKPADIKNSLFQLFSGVGEVHEVHCKKNVRMRGQAFVVANNEEVAEQMIKELRGAMFYGKPLRLKFARNDSDFIAKLKGTFEPSVYSKRKVRHQEFERLRELKAKRKMINKVLMLRKQNMDGSMGPDAAGVAGRNGQFGGVGSQSGNLLANMRQPERYKILFIEKLPKNMPK